MLEWRHHPEVGKVVDMVRETVATVEDTLPSILRALRSSYEAILKPPPSFLPMARKLWKLLDTDSLDFIHGN